MRKQMEHEKTIALYQRLSRDYELSGERTASSIKRKCLNSMIGIVALPIPLTIHMTDDQKLILTVLTGSGYKIHSVVVIK